MQNADWFSRKTRGAFDCTVQPVWQALAEHFTSAVRSTPPSPGLIERSRRSVGYERLHISEGLLELPAGGAVTLNGIAQGYITDRIADILESAGWHDALISLGETRALPGRPWPVRIAHSDVRISLARGAVATSSGAGTPLSADGRWHHLLDPRTAASRNHFKAVTVRARRAVTADALSTALAAASPEEVGGIAARFPDVTALVIAHDGSVRRL